jgi:hypothetical protein
MKKKGQRRNIYFVLGLYRSHFVLKKPRWFYQIKLSETHTIKMLDFLIDIIFVIFGVRVGQQKIWILLIIPFGGKHWIHTRRAH